MPDRTALIAVLIMERPLCVSCISSKTGLTHGEVESYLARIEDTVAVKQAPRPPPYMRQLGAGLLLAPQGLGLPAPVYDVLT